MRFLVKVPAQSRVNAEFRLCYLWVHGGRSCKPQRREIPQSHSLAPVLNYAHGNFFFSFYLNIINTVSIHYHSLSVFCAFQQRALFSLSLCYWVYWQTAITSSQKFPFSTLMISVPSAFPTGHVLQWHWIPTGITWVNTHCRSSF